MEMITIDGKEGGGQVLRVALGLSAVTGEPIKVTNIRGSRDGGVGLKSQHLEGVLAIAKLCNADIKGAKLGSTEIEFVPGRIEGKDLGIRLPTAGSIGLLFQSLQLPSAFAASELRFQISGGSTASAWSPTLSYVQNAFLPIVRKLGYKADIRIVRHGFYPKGGAEAQITVYPIRKLSSISLTESGMVKSVKGASVAGSLPTHVVDRQTDSAKRVLKDHGLSEVEISSQSVNTISPGTSITLWAECENTVLGSDAIGEKGLPAEKVGEDAALRLIKSIESRSCLDKHMSDQILVFLALATGKSQVTLEEFTGHVRTSIRVIEQILAVKFETESEKRLLCVDGIGFSKS
jgi:RNA 3'-phosphate cyclase